MKKNLTKEQKLIKKGLKVIYLAGIQHRGIDPKHYSEIISRIMDLSRDLKMGLNHGINIKHFPCPQNINPVSESELIEKINDFEKFLNAVHPCTIKNSISDLSKP